MHARAFVSNAARIVSLLVIVLCLFCATSAHAQLQGTIVTGCLPAGASTKGKACVVVINGKDGKGKCDDKGKCIPELPPETPEQKQMREQLVNMCVSQPENCKTFLQTPQDSCDQACKQKLYEVLGQQSSLPDPLKSLFPNTEPQPSAAPQGTINLPTMPVETDAAREINLISRSPNTGGEGTSNGVPGAVTSGSSDRTVKPGERLKGTITYEYVDPYAYEHVSVERLFDGYIPGGFDFGYVSPLSGLTGFSSVPQTFSNYAPSPVSSAQPAQPQGVPNTRPSPTTPNPSIGSQNPFQNFVENIAENISEMVEEAFKNLGLAPFEPEYNNEYDSSETPGPTQPETNEALDALVQAPNSNNVSDAFYPEPQNPVTTSEPASQTAYAPGQEIQPLSEPGSTNEIIQVTNSYSNDASFPAGQTSPQSEHLEETAEGISDIGNALAAIPDSEVQNDLRDLLQQTQEKLAQTEARAELLAQSLNVANNRLAMSNAIHRQEINDLTQKLEQLTEGTKAELANPVLSAQERISITQQYIETASRALDALEKSLEAAPELPPTLGSSFAGKLSQGVLGLGTIVGSFVGTLVTTSLNVSAWLGNIFHSLFGF